MTLPLTAPDSMLRLMKISIALLAIEKAIGRHLTPAERDAIVVTIPEVI